MGISTGVCPHAPVHRGLPTSACRFPPRTAQTYSTGGYSCHLLVPGVGELIGGSQREERVDVMERRMLDSGLDPAASNVLDCGMDEPSRNRWRQTAAERRVETRGDGGKPRVERRG